MSFKRVQNPPNPWRSVHLEWIDAPPPEAELEIYEEQAKTVLSENDSPDVGFRWSVNPYRGCFHACAYCYARPSHQYWDFGAGTDFERKIIVKTNAPEKLREQFRKSSWQGELVVFSGNTDCYQPLESSYELTRRCLEVCRDFQNPVGMITKSALVRRDIDVIAETLIRVGQLAADHPEIRELDINPLLADAEGIIALDTRIRIAPAEAAGAARLAIAPYPRELERTERLGDGGAVQTRPIRPEDEPVVVKLFDHMSPEDLRLRFFAPIRHLSHTLAARLTQIDYDREMALLALQDGAAVGIAHFYADPDRQRAEYAIAVRTAEKGRGIGYLLLTRLIDIARRWGVGELVGEVLRENERMLQMCRALGFRITQNPEDGAVLLVHKPLTDPTPN